MTSSTTTTTSNRPWLSWPMELPDSKAALADFKELHWLNDPKLHREMAQEQRARLLKSAETWPTLNGAAIILAGGRSEDFELYDSDTEKCEFRQEAFFRYLFAINEPDCYGVILLSKDPTKCRSLLFVPFVSEDSQRWNGERRPLAYYTEQYGVNETFIRDDLTTVLRNENINHLYVLHGQNLDSGSMTRTPVTFEGIDSFTIDRDLLHRTLAEQRVIKTANEIQVMRVGNLISSQAHVYVMRHIRAGMVEIQLEALFKSYNMFFGGCRHMAYTCICGSGANGSILHYGHAGRPNDRILKETDTVVLDMGGEFNGYATDITRGFAVSGRFTPDQAAIHTAVYEASQAVMRALKPGVNYQDMHRLAERVILEHLLKIGIVKDATVDELAAAQVGSVFMPHGLGHLIGMNVHDVGGYEHGACRDSSPGLCWLRCGRSLQPGMTLTVEPGIYFNDAWLNFALADPSKSRYIDSAVLDRFRGTGGCRIEDDVVITESGCENLTIIPASVSEIEELMAQARQ